MIERWWAAIPGYALGVLGLFMLVVQGDPAGWAVIGLGLVLVVGEHWLRRVP